MSRCRPRTALARGRGPALGRGPPRRARGNRACACTRGACRARTTRGAASGGTGRGCSPKVQVVQPGSRGPGSGRRSASPRLLRLARLGGCPWPGASAQRLGCRAAALALRPFRRRRCGCGRRRCWRDVGLPWSGAARCPECCIRPRHDASGRTCRCDGLDRRCDRRDAASDGPTRSSGHTAFRPTRATAHVGAAAALVATSAACIRPTDSIRTSREPDTCPQALDASAGDGGRCCRPATASATPVAWRSSSSDRADWPGVVGPLPAGHVSRTSGAPGRWAASGRGCRRWAAWACRCRQRILSTGVGGGPSRYG